MMFLRGPIVLSALIALAGSTCRSQTDPGDGAPKAAATAPEVHIQEVDTSALTPRERREWATQVSELLAPCADTPVSIAQCATEHRACKTCIPAAEFLLRQVQAGKAKKDREEAFHARFDAGKVKTIVLDGSPEKGPADAPVTIVEWADFECPFCKLMYPLLEELGKRFDGQVRVVYKFYPLSAHPHGEVAARAAIAAGDQGKFWEMHHLLFDNQERLEQADLEGYAKQLGLDVAKFKAAMVSKTTDERIAQDKKQADGLGLEGTPFLFVDGREVLLEKLGNPYDDLEHWVKLEIELAGQKPHAAPAAPSSSAAAGAAPSSSAAAGAAPSASSAAAAPSSSAGAKPASTAAPPAHAAHH